ncbi:MAG: hypothetical protein AAGI01_05170 [Myxococcota bacterium]
MSRTTQALLTTIALALLLAPACSASRARKGDLAVGERTIARKGDALQLVFEVEQPDWLLTPRPNTPTPTLGDVRLVSFGQQLSLHQTARGVFAVHADEGVLGALVLPDGAVWAGVDDGDRVYTATGDGGFWRADSARAALRGGFVKIQDIPGARAWDVSRDMVIGVGDTVYHSRDLGQTLTPSTPVEGFSIQHVAVRPDGVIVASGFVPDHETSRAYVSRDRGATWEESTFHPELITRMGRWIWNASDTCPAILASDGVTWSSDPTLSELPGRGDVRSAWLQLTDAAMSPAGQLPDTLDAPAPPDPAPAMVHAGETPTCKDPILTAAEVRERGAPDALRERGPQGMPCVGVQCLREALGSGAPVAPVHAALLADGACAAQQRDATTGACEEGAAMARAPHMIFVETAPGSRRLGVSELPRACVPVRLLSAYGMALLLCALGEGQTELFTRSPSSTWVSEAIFEVAPGSIRDFSAARDGTVVLHGVCPPAEVGECAASFLRAPERVGATDAWSRLEIPDQLLARPVPGGGALVVSARSDQTSAAFLWRVRGDGTLEELPVLVGLGEQVRDVRLREDGLVEVLVGDGFASMSRLVDGDGTLKAP